VATPSDAMRRVLLRHGLRHVVRAGHSEACPTLHCAHIRPDCSAGAVLGSGAPADGARRGRVRACEARKHPQTTDVQRHRPRQRDRRRLVWKQGASLGWEHGGACGLASFTDVLVRRSTHRRAQNRRAPRPPADRASHCDSALIAHLLAQRSPLARITQS